MYIAFSFIITPVLNNVNFISAVFPMIFQLSKSLVCNLNLFSLKYVCTERILIPLVRIQVDFHDQKKPRKKVIGFQNF